MLDSQTRQPLPPMPSKIAALPRDPRGFPAPWFCHRDENGFDFRVVRRGGLSTAVNGNLCWVCGRKNYRNVGFLLGPMCSITRTISEPPSHRDCAEWSARACPFLTRPRMRRNERDLPEEIVPAAGFGLSRNPGVVALWVTRSYKPFRAPGGVLFEVGNPIEVLWFCEGRAATRAEAQASIASGLPALQEMCEQEDSPALCEQARVDLARMVARAEAYLPA